MRHRPEFRGLVRLTAAVMVAVRTLAASPPEPAWTLQQEGCTYTYTLTVTTGLPADVLLDVLFQPRHVAAFSKSAGRLVVLKEDGSVNEVRFDTRRFIFKCTTTFRRALDQEAGTIDIEMTGFKAGWGKLAPHARTSRARYRVTDHGSHREVLYRQDVETDKPVSGYSLRALRKSMGEFARDLDEYLQRPDLARNAGEPAAVAR